MRRLLRIVMLPILLLANLSTWAGPSEAQASRFQYAVKFVCGGSDGRVAALGYYFTAINVHNPRYESVLFRYKVAVAKPGFESGPVTTFGRTGLRADAAFEIDCPDLWRLTGTKPGLLLKGFLVIETDVELDVVAVYTAAASQDRPVSTMDVERVEARVR